MSGSRLRLRGAYVGVDAQPVRLRSAKLEGRRREVVELVGGLGGVDGDVRGLCKPEALEIGETLKCREPTV